MKQSDIFLQGEGRAWIERNKSKLPIDKDPLLETLNSTIRDELKQIQPRSLEIGCADGWRVKKMRKEWGWIAYGIDPAAPDDISPDSEHWGSWKYIFKGVAHNLHPIKADCFDVVIYGFCLYLCDPEDYFRIASEGNRVLKDGGYLVIYDFYSSRPVYRPYSHHSGVLSRKLDWSKLWLAHPYYHLDSIQLFPETRVTILRKSIAGAFVEEGQ